MRIVGVMFAFIVFAVTACLPATAPPPSTPTLTAPPSITWTPTATVVWFPATATHTPFPTQPVTPTPDLRIGIGDVLLEDSFAAPGEWELQATTSGRVSVVHNELTLAIVEPGVFLFSTRPRSTFGNFYLEITSLASLCTGVDEYGLMLRVTPDLDYYRYSLSCDGQIRLDRIHRGGAAALVPWTHGSGVPPGVPVRARLGVWAYGDELRFFVNDQHQFTVNDPLISSGNLGVFARSANDTAVTVSFSELIVRAINLEGE